jgi:hypothetical protein
MLMEIHAQRENSFRHLKANGIKKSALDNFESFLTAPGTLSRPSLIVRCQIANGDCNVRVIVDKRISQSRLGEVFLPFFRRALPQPCGRSEFFVLISDNLYVAQDRLRECIEYFKNVPFFRCDQSSDDELSMHTVLIPDFFMQNGKYADELNAINETVDKHPFEQRIDIVKWRGSLHGPGYANNENYLQFPRYLLLMKSLERPEIVDARLTNYYVEDSDSGAVLRKRLEEIFGPPAEFIPSQGFVPYKFLISIDGAVAAWKRTATILAAGSVLLLQHRWNEFFYPGLKPWIHYVPLKDDISDLIEQYEWLTEHPAQAKRIAKNGLNFARAILTPRALQTYFGEIVAECGRLYIP